MKGAKRILVVRQENKLGDVMMATPVFAALKKALGNCHITALVHRDLHPVLQHNPDVDALWHTDYRPQGSRLFLLLKQLRRAKFDAVALLRPNSGTHTVLSLFALIPLRAGSATKYYARFLTHNAGIDLWKEPVMHWIELSLRIAEFAAEVTLDPMPIRLVVPSSAIVRSRDLLAKVRDRDYFCIHPGTGGSSQSWYPEKYGQAARMICRETGWRAVVTATPSEMHLADVVCAQAGNSCIHLGGKTDVAVLAAVLRGAKLLVSGDTGVVHVAASVGTPCVVVHTGADYDKKTRVFHPWMVPYRTVHPRQYCENCSEHDCQHKGDACLQSISVDEVVQAAIVLAEQRA